MSNQTIRIGSQSPPDDQVICQHLTSISKHILTSKLECDVICKVCAYPGRNQWICLQYACDFALCTSEDLSNVVEHAQSSAHPVFLNMKSGQVYCQFCEICVGASDSSEPAFSGNTQSIYPYTSDMANLDFNKYNKPLGICGLVNLGNTCYMNAALQALSNCPQVTENFLRCPDLLYPKRGQLAAQYQNFLQTTWRTPKSSVISPVPILREVKSHYPMFSGYSQHDSQEFLRVFLNHLHDELKSPRPLPIKSTGPSGEAPTCHCSATTTRSKPKLNKKNRAKIKQINNNPCMCSANPVQSLLCNRDSSTASDGHSIITDVFQGKMMSAVRCLSCQRVSCRKEPFLDLSVSVGQSCANMDTQRWVIAPILHRLVPPIVKPDQNLTKSLSDHPAAYPTNSTQSPRSSHFRSTSNKSATEAVSTRALQSLSRLRVSIPLMRRAIVYILGLIMFSFSWIFTKITDVQGWFSSPALTLDDCLMDYFSQFELNGENKYRCDQCKKLCNGVNETTILALPEVLCIHLKRFRSHNVDAYKITSNVMFPLDGLEMKPLLHANCQDKVTTYDLIGVICHMGGCGGGHYVSCARNWRLQTWFEFDDDHVSQVTPQHVEGLTSEAYVLFYRKRDTAIVPFRQEAVRLCQEYSLSNFTHHVSRSWFVRFTTWAEPGPIDNETLLCPHGKMKPESWEDRQSVLISIPEALWIKLQAKFGGCPAIVDVSPCSTCRSELVTRQNQELVEYDRIFEECQPSADTLALCAIDSQWFTSWKNFVNGVTYKIPGAIDNKELVDSRPNSGLFSHSTRTGSLLRTPILNSDASYIVLFEACWEFLVATYGGGPHLRLRQPRLPPTTPCTEPIQSIETKAKPKSPTVATGILSDSENSREADRLTRMEYNVPTTRTEPPPPITDVKPHPAESYSSLVNGDSESGIYSSVTSNYTTSIKGHGDVNDSAHNRNLSATSCLSFSSDSLLSNPKGDGTSEDLFHPTNSFRLSNGYKYTNGSYSYSAEHLPTFSDTTLRSELACPSGGELNGCGVSDLIPDLVSTDNISAYDHQQNGVKTHKRTRLSTPRKVH